MCGAHHVFDIGQPNRCCFLADHLWRARSRQQRCLQWQLRASARAHERLLQRGSWPELQTFRDVHNASLGSYGPTDRLSRLPATSTFLAPSSSILSPVPWMLSVLVLSVSFSAPTTSF